MFADTFFRRVAFNTLGLAFSFIFNLCLLYKVYTSDTVIISFAIHPFNICEDYPEIWEKLKLLYVFITFLSSIICINLIYSSLFSKKLPIKKKNIKSNHSDLSISIQNSNLKEAIILPEASLYQNILITGTIGSGKTSSVMYPFTRQLIKYKYEDMSQKLGLLILDVKGNYYSQVKKYASYYRREDDLVVIELRWKYKI